MRGIEHFKDGEVFVPDHDPSLSAHCGQKVLSPAPCVQVLIKVDIRYKRADTGITDDLISTLFYTLWPKSSLPRSMCQGLN